MEAVVTATPNMQSIEFSTNTVQQPHQLHPESFYNIAVQILELYNDRTSKGGTGLLNGLRWGSSGSLIDEGDKDNLSNTNDINDEASLTDDEIAYSRKEAQKHLSASQLKQWKKAQKSRKKNADSD